MAVKRNRSGVLCARWAMAAVVMSPPQVSSIVIAMPSDTHRSRICRAWVRPPTLEILRLMTSMRLVGVRAHQHVEAVDHLVEHEGVVGVPPHGQALLVA